jgi:hypothetical protein
MATPLRSEAATRKQLIDKHVRRAGYFDATTQSILGKAFRGGLVPTEAELAKAERRTYETAEQLLARIKTAQSSPAGERRRSARGRVRVFDSMVSTKSGT